MGLFDKIKDLFTDEEVYEEDKSDRVKIKEIKKEEVKKNNDDLIEDKLPTFMREKIAEEEKFKLDDEKEKDEEVNLSSRVNARINNNVYTEDTVELPKKVDNSFKFPVSFDDDDYVPSRLKNNSSDDVRINNNNVVSKVEKEITVSVSEKIERPVNQPSRVADLYKDGNKSEQPKFKATPIISPIYGILDKNYSKDQIVEVSQETYELKRTSISKGVDFESVRRKAYGSLSDDIKDNLMCENCELLKEAKEEKRKKEVNDNLVYDILKDENVSENVEEIDKDITFGDASDNYYDYGVAYEPPKQKVPKRVREEENRESIKIVNSEKVEDKPFKKEVPPVKSSINLLSTLKKSMGEVESDEILESTSKKREKKNLELTDDLFNLIDSMYEERND